MRRGGRPTVSEARLSGVQQGQGWRTIKRVAPYLWPAGETQIRARVVLAMALLFAAKLISVVTPMSNLLLMSAMRVLSP